MLGDERERERERESSHMWGGWNWAAAAGGQQRLSVACWTLHCPSLPNITVSPHTHCVTVLLSVTTTAANDNRPFDSKTFPEIGIFTIGRGKFMT